MPFPAEELWLKATGLQGGLLLASRGDEDAMPHLDGITDVGDHLRCQDGGQPGKLHRLYPGDVAQWM